MKDALKANKRAAITISSLVGFLLISATLSACQLQDMIKFEVPEKVQAAIDTEDRVPVSKSDQVWEDWQVFVERQNKRLAEAIGSAQEQLAIIESLTETGISLGQDAASTLPGGALISSGLALMGGLFLKRPGDKKREKEQTDASFDAGLKRGREIAQAASQAIAALKESQSEEKDADA